MKGGSFISNFTDPAHGCKQFCPLLRNVFLSPSPPPYFFFLNIKLKWEAGQGKQKEGPKGVVELEWFLTCVQIICKLTPVMAFLQRGRNIQQSVCKGIWILMDIMSAYSILTDCDVLELLKKSCQS